MINNGFLYYVRHPDIVKEKRNNFPARTAAKAHERAAASRVIIPSAIRKIRSDRAARASLCVTMMKVMFR